MMDQTHATSWARLKKPIACRLCRHSQQIKWTSLLSATVHEKKKILILSHFAQKLESDFTISGKDFWVEQWSTLEQNSPSTFMDCSDWLLGDHELKRPMESTDEIWDSNTALALAKLCLDLWLFAHQVALKRCIWNEFKIYHSSLTH